MEKSVDSEELIATLGKMMKAKDATREEKEIFERLIVIAGQAFTKDFPAELSEHGRNVFGSIVHAIMVIAMLCSTSGDEEGMRICERICKAAIYAFSGDD